MYIILASIIFVGIVGISHGQGLFELNDVKHIAPKMTLGYSGHVTAILKNSDGTIIGYQQSDNDVMDRGVNCSSDRVFDTTFAPGPCNIVRYMAIGSSSINADATQLNLFDKLENGNELALLTGVFGANTGNVSPDLMLINTFTILAADNGDAVAEAGLFDSSSTSTANMFARVNIGPFTMVSTDSQVQIVWTIHVD